MTHKRGSYIWSAVLYLIFCILLILIKFISNQVFFGGPQGISVLLIFHQDLLFVYFVRQAFKEHVISCKASLVT